MNRGACRYALFLALNPSIELTTIDKAAWDVIIFSTHRYHFDDRPERYMNSMSVNQGISGWDTSEASSQIEEEESRKENPKFEYRSTPSLYFGYSRP